MGAKRKSYSPAYRREAARLVIETGRRIVEVAREIGVGEALLGRWVAIERAHMDGEPPQALDADERAELERLRRGVAELRRFAVVANRVGSSPISASTRAARTGPRPGAERSTGAHGCASNTTATRAATETPSASSTGPLTRPDSSGCPPNGVNLTPRCQREDG